MQCSLIKPNINNITFSSNKRVNKNHSNNLTAKNKKIPGKSLIGLTFLVALSGFIAKKYDIIRSLPFNSKPYSINTPTEWDPKFKILASSSQKHFSTADFYIDKFEQPKYIGCYTQALLDNLKNSKIKTIQQANDLLLKNGYTGSINLSLLLDDNAICNNQINITQFPVESGSNINMWDKKDHSKHRFMIFISGNDGMADTDSILDKFQEIYNIPEFNIYNIQQANTEDIKNVIESVSQQIKEYGRSNSEILIYYGGHGYANDWKDPKKEGEAQAYFKIDEDNILNEKTFRKFLNEKLKGVKSCIIFDACRSGAWISKKEIKELDSIG